MPKLKIADKRDAFDLATDAVTDNYLVSLLDDIETSGLNVFEARLVHHSYLIIFPNGAVFALYRVKAGS